jgi:hypothetical protein
MRFQIATSRRRVAGLAGTGALVLGAVVGVAVSGAGAADAATIPCNAAAVGPPAVAATTCAAAGTATLTAGALTLTAPATLTWGTTLGGVAATAVDTATADQTLTVDDATGSGAGWAVSVAATQFTSGANTLPDLGTFSVNGSISTPTVGATPGAACTTTGDCTLPTSLTDPVSYPVAVTTGAAVTPVNIYTADALTGIGSIILGAPGVPIGWWIAVPATALAGAYTSTVNLTITSGP